MENQALRKTENSEKQTIENYSIKEKENTQEHKNNAPTEQKVIKIKVLLKNIVIINLNYDFISCRGFITPSFMCPTVIQFLRRKMTENFLRSQK